MTIKSTETLQAIVGKIAGGMLCYTDAARAAGASPASFWRWMKQSAAGDVEFIIEFMGEQVQFAEAVKNARKLAILDIAGKFETRMANGHDEVLTYQGRIQYKERTECIGLSDDVVRLLGYPHRWQTDENGEPIPLTIHHPPPVAGVIKVLESHFKQYTPRSETTVNNRLSGGVTIVDPRKPKPLPTPVVQIAPPPQTTIEPSDDLADADDDDDDSGLDLSDILGEPSADVAPVEMASEPEPTPAPQPDPMARAELSELERDLLDRLRAGPKNPRPTALVMTGNSSSRADDPIERGA